MEMGSPVDSQPQPDDQQGADDKPFEQMIKDVSQNLSEIADALEQAGEKEGSAKMAQLAQEFQKTIMDIGQKRQGPAGPGAAPSRDPNAGAAGVPAQ